MASSRTSIVPPESHALMNVRTSSNEQETVHTGEEVCEETDASEFRESSSSFAAALAATVPQVAEKTRQDWIENAAALFVVSGAVSKTAKHGGLYARFADDLVMLEAGMVGAQLGLQAAALGLGATPVGAFEEDEVKRATFASKNRDATSGRAVTRRKASPDAAPDERPILMYAVGVPKGSYRGEARRDAPGGRSVSRRPRRRGRRARDEETRGETTPSGRC